MPSTERWRKTPALETALSSSRARPPRRYAQDDGQTLTTDGPYAHNPEVFGAYYVFEVDHPDEAIELAARFPVARLGGAIEVRPLVER